eukprot:5247278-Alexandrium_andersonii.AAC.1
MQPLVFVCWLKAQLALRLFKLSFVGCHLQGGLAPDVASTKEGQTCSGAAGPELLLSRTTTRAGRGRGRPLQGPR